MGSIYKGTLKQRNEVRARFMFYVKICKRSSFSE